MQKNKNLAIEILMDMTCGLGIVWFICSSILH